MSGDLEGEAWEEEYDRGGESAFETALQQQLKESQTLVWLECQS